jgi:hypothetical protein
MTSLQDLPTLGGKKKQKEEFGDFDFAEDHIGDSSNKLDDAERRLSDFYQEQKNGYRVQVPKGAKETKPKQPEKKGVKSGFKVRIDGVDQEEEEIAEEIQTDRDDFTHAKNVGLTESGGHGTGITVSQSLGVDPSVDSLALDEYDHIEMVMN